MVPKIAALIAALSGLKDSSNISAIIEAPSIFNLSGRQIFSSRSRQPKPILANNKMKYQWFLILVLSIANIGCAKLGQTTLTEDLLGEQAAWLDDSLEDSDQLANNEKIEEEDSEPAQRKITDLAQQASTKIPIKLTSEPPKKSSDQLRAVTPLSSGHSDECDSPNFKENSEPLIAAPPAVSTQPHVFSKHSLRPLNKKTSAHTKLTHNKSVNSLRSSGITDKLRPLALKQKPRLRPMASKVLPPSKPLIANNGPEALAQLNHANKSEIAVSQTWNKLPVFDSDQANDCLDCEAGVCETKDKTITPENSMVITEPTFAMLSAPSLANATFESEASPPAKLVAQNKPVPKPDIHIRQVNNVQPESSTIIEHAFALPATLNSESPISGAKENHSNAFIPKSNREGNANNSLAGHTNEKDQVEAIAELQIKNSAICWEIKGFGQHKPFAENKFRPGQPFLVYCEIENYESKDQKINSEKVVQSRFQGRYQIKNRDGELVQSGDFPIIEDNAPKRRRDFYLYFKIELNRLNPGNYQLQMEISDLIGQKTGNLEQDLLFNVQ